MTRKWSAKYKKSINCSKPKGFSQKQYCKYGRKKKSNRKSPKKKSRRKISKKKSRRKSPKRKSYRRGTAALLNAGEYPDSPVLNVELSGVNTLSINSGIEGVLNLIIHNGWDVNAIKYACSLLSTATMSQNPQSLPILEWVESIGVNKGTTHEMYETYSGRHRLQYFRNFSSRPPIDGEEDDKIWTEEPILEFISKLLESGIYQRDDDTDESSKISNGCVEIACASNDGSRSHAFIICRNLEGELSIVDVQAALLISNAPGELVTAPKIIITDINEIVRYFAGYNCNYFTIMTTDKAKYDYHKGILNSRLRDVSLNKELNDRTLPQYQVILPEGLTDDSVPPSLIINILTNTVGFHPSFPGSQILTTYSTQNDIYPIYELTAVPPELLAVPYDAPYYKEFNNNHSFLPLIINIDDYSLQWPRSVREKAAKYRDFQELRYPAEVRKAALSAILNGKDNPELDRLLTSDEALDNLYYGEDEYWNLMQERDYDLPPKRGWWRPQMSMMIRSLGIEDDGSLKIIYPAQAPTENIPTAEMVSKAIKKESESFILYYYSKFEPPNIET